MKKEVITCSNCGKDYNNIFSLEGNQAYGCASDVVEQNGSLMVYSHYGSTFDTSRHLASLQANIKVGVICDDCISKLRYEGFLTEDPSHDYWGALDSLRKSCSEEYDYLENLEEDSWEVEIRFLAKTFFKNGVKITTF